MSSRLPTLVGISQRLRRPSEAMSTENESLSNRSRSLRDEADTLLTSRGLKAGFWRLRSGVQAPVHITHYRVDRRPGCLPLVQPSRSRGTSVVPNPHRISSTCWAGRRKVISFLSVQCSEVHLHDGACREKPVSMTTAQYRPAFRMPQCVAASHALVLFPCRLLAILTNRMAKDK